MEVEEFLNILRVIFIGVLSRLQLSARELSELGKNDFCQEKVLVMDFNDFQKTKTEQIATHFLQYNNEIHILTIIPFDVYEAIHEFVPLITFKEAGELLIDLNTITTASGFELIKQPIEQGRSVFFWVIR